MLPASGELDESNTAADGGRHESRCGAAVSKLALPIQAPAERLTRIPFYSASVIVPESKRAKKKTSDHRNWRGLIGGRVVPQLAITIIAPAQRGSI
jgi:hypothetical protein